MKHYEIKFQYADDYSHYEWRNQMCSLYAMDKEEAIDKCIELYGLDGCDYKILSVTEIK